MAFKKITIQGVTHNFDHLNDQTLRLYHRDTDYTVIIKFSHHCFTVSRDAAHPPDHHYDFYCPVNEITDNRTYCPQRHAYSLSLPAIVQALPRAYAYFNPNKTNYLVLSGNPLEQGGHDYYLFFRLQRLSKGSLGDVMMFIESAHTRSQSDRAAPIRFSKLVDEIANGRRPKPAPVTRLNRINLGTTTNVVAVPTPPASPPGAVADNDDSINASELTGDSMKTKK